MILSLGPAYSWISDSKHTCLIFQKLFQSIKLEIYLIFQRRRHIHFTRSVKTRFYLVSEQNLNKKLHTQSTACKGKFFPRHLLSMKTSATFWPEEVVKLEYLARIKTCLRAWLKNNPSNQVDYSNIFKWDQTHSNGKYTNTYFKYIKFGWSASFI